MSDNCARERRGICAWLRLRLGLGLLCQQRCDAGTRYHTLCHPSHSGCLATPPSPTPHTVWELLTCEKPFRGLLEYDLVTGVCDKGLRPIFPPGSPASYATLAQQCWANDPAQRPTAAQVCALVWEWACCSSPLLFCRTHGMSEHVCVW